MSDDNPLEFFTTRELLDELMRRHEHAVFAGMLVRGIDGKDGLVRSREVKGNLITCAGLGTWIAKFAMDNDDRDCSEFKGEK